MTGADAFAHELVAGSHDVLRGDDHVDHAVFADYVARVRESYLRATVPRFEVYPRPVVNLELDYRQELFPGDRLTGTIDLEAIGETSLTTVVTLTHDGAVAATGRTVQVVLDPDTGEPVRVPDDWRTALRE